MELLSFCDAGFNSNLINNNENIYNDEHFNDELKCLHHAFLLLEVKKANMGCELQLWLLFFVVNQSIDYFLLSVKKTSKNDKQHQNKRCKSSSGTCFIILIKSDLISSFFKKIKINSDVAAACFKQPDKRLKTLRFKER